MSLWAKIRGTAEAAWQIGLAGPQLKNNAGAIETRNSADSTFAVARAANPLASNDLVTQMETLLYIEPSAETGAVDATYAPTYVASRVTQEAWTRNDTTKIKTIDYTYVNNRCTTEVRKVFAADGTTIVAQATWSYTYATTRSRVASATMTRDV